MSESIDEEIHPRLAETWKEFDEKVRSLDVKYDIAADEPLRQAFTLPYKDNNDKNVWKGVADFMYDTDNVKSEQVILKVDPGYKKGEVLFSFMVAAINDDIQDRIMSIFKTQPHITLHMKPTNGPQLDDAPDLGRIPEEDPIHQMPSEDMIKLSGLIAQDEAIANAFADIASRCDGDIAEAINSMLNTRNDALSIVKNLIGRMNK